MGQNIEKIHSITKNIFSLILLKGIFKDAFYSIGS